MPALNQERESSSGLSLAVRLQDDCLGAWTELVELYGPLIESWLTSADLDPAGKEDVAQEVFLAVYRNIQRFDPRREGATFRGWLWQITRNAMLKYVEKRNLRGCGGTGALQQFAVVADSGAGGSSIDSASSAADVAGLLSRAMTRLKPQIEPQTWEAFWQTAVLGRNATEVASTLGMTAAAVRQAKSRTLRRLRQQLGDV